jgi:hypothetical protein
MAARISTGMQRISRGWVALIALVIFLLFTALVLPAQSSQAEADSGGAGSPDTSLFYSPQELYRLAEAYGPQGRAAYVRARFTFDLIWPIVYAFFLTTAISWVYGRAFAPDSWLQRANLVPLLGLLFDYLENISTSLVMLRYPDLTPVAAWLAPLFTLLKWTFVGGSFVVLLVGLAAGLWRWIQRRAY